MTQAQRNEENQKCTVEQQINFTHYDMVQYLTRVSKYGVSIQGQTKNWKKENLKTMRYII